MTTPDDYYDDPILNQARNADDHARGFDAMTDTGDGSIDQLRTTTAQWIATWTMDSSRIRQAAELTTTEGGRRLLEDAARYASVFDDINDAP